MQITYSCPYPQKNDQKETIELHDAGTTLPAEIDLLKLDTEGNEVPIFTSISEKLSSIKLIYYEYHSVQDRIILEDMLCSILYYRDIFH